MGSERSARWLLPRALLKTRQVMKHSGHLQITFCLLDTTWPLTVLSEDSILKLALVVAQLKQRVTGDSEEGKQKLPVVEKQSRLAEQKLRLNGIDITGELQPSYSFIDLVNNMIETSSVLWIAPSKSTSRDQEILHGAKNLPSVVQLEQHTLKLSPPDSAFEADCSSTLQLQWCLQRRALALDQVRLSSWDCQTKWINQLMTTLNTPPPPGHSTNTGTAYQS